MIVNNSAQIYKIAEYKPHFLLKIAEYIPQFLSKNAECKPHFCPKLRIPFRSFYSSNKSSKTTWFMTAFDHWLVAMPYVVTITVRTALLVPV